MKRGINTYLIIVISLFPFALFFSFSKPWGIESDFWLTAATIRELAKNLFHPSNPILDLSGESSARFVPYTVFWGFFMRITNFGIFIVMGIASIVNYLLFVSGIYLFVTKQFQNKNLPSYVLLAMLFVWGTGYRWANAYHLDMFLLTLPYVGCFVFSISMYALYFLRSYCDKEKYYFLVLYVITASLAFITHPITGAFCFVAAFALLLADGNLKRLIYLQAAPVLAILISMLWPYFNYLDVFTIGTIEPWFKSALFKDIGFALGASAAGLPILIFYAIKKKHLFMVYGFSFCFLVYLLSAFFDILIGGEIYFL